jgi:hypothetical protein
MDLSTLNPEVFINAPADPPLLSFFVQRGAIDFFTSSEAWQETNEVEVDAGEREFVVPAVAGADFLKLVAVEIAGTELRSASLGAFCSADESGKVTLASPAEGLVTLKVTCAYVPSGNTVNDAIGRQYRDGIVSAALSKLFILPKKPWTDPNLSEYHRNKWQSLAATAKRHAYVGKNAAPLRTKPHTVGGR